MILTALSEKRSLGINSTQIIQLKILRLREVNSLHIYYKMAELVLKFMSSETKFNAFSTIP